MLPPAGRPPSPAAGLPSAHPALVSPSAAEDAPGAIPVSYDGEGRVTDWPVAAARLTGIPAPRALGSPLVSVFGAHRRWSDRLAELTAGTEDRPAAHEDWLWRPDGSRVYLSLGVRTGTRELQLRDLTARRLQDAYADTVYAVGRAALHAETVEALIRRTLLVICESLEWEAGAYWEVDGLSGRLRCRSAITVGGWAPLGVDAGDGTTTVDYGQELAGRVWESGQAEVTRGGFGEHPVFATAPRTALLRTGFAFPIEGRAGTLGVFEFASLAVETPGRDLFRTVAILSNHVSQFSDRFRAEQALRESDAQKTAILATALDGIIRVTGEGRIVELNDAAERTFGQRAGVMLQGELADLVADPDEGAKLAGELAALASADATQGGRRLTTRMRRANGEDFPVDLAITRVPLAGPAHFSICVRDLSEQERLQQALSHAQKMESLGHLASGIAHDFNNFLTVIRGQAERLSKHLTGDDPRHRWVASILKVAERASTLTGQLLAFGRRGTEPVAVIDLNAIVESTAVLLGTQLGDAVRWQLSLARDVGLARIGDSQAQRILFNLALNARDAMSQGGRLTVTTEPVELSAIEARRLLLPTGVFVRLSVEDTGRGMDARTRSRVFEPFFTTKKLGDGTGLGLSTVYAIVQQCGGQITVTSRVGEGTRFDIYLPRVTDAAEGPGEVLRSSTRALGGLTVLLVEDEAEIRAIARDILVEHGAHVLDRPDGPSALDVVEERADEIDLLLTDLMMPGMSGRELAERVVARCPDVSVMFVSGHPAVVGERTLGGRPVALLRKPFSGDELVRRVRRAVAP